MATILLPYDFSPIDYSEKPRPKKEANRDFQKFNFFQHFSDSG